MKALSLRAQLGLVAAGYAAVLAASTFLVVERRLQYVRHPEDANQYSGMWAGGDMIVGVFIFCLFLVPTLFLVLVMRKSEPLYTGYTKVLLVLSLTAPVSIGLLAIPVVRESDSLLGFVCMWRLFASPFVLVGMAGSRLLARFPRAKRFSLYAALIEAATLGTMILLLGVSASWHRGGWGAETRTLRGHEMAALPPQSKTGKGRTRIHSLLHSDHADPHGRTSWRWQEYALPRSGGRTWRHCD